MRPVIINVDRCSQKTFNYSFISNSKVEIYGIGPSRVQLQLRTKENERVELVPPFSPCPTDGGAPSCMHDTEHGSMAVDQIEQGRSTAKLWRPTRDAGLLIGGLVVLVLLIATTSTAWINHGSSVSLIIDSHYINLLFFIG